MTELTGQEAIALLERAVAEKGADYVYPFEVESLTTRRGLQLPNGVSAACAYYYNGQPSCIVGHVAHYLGVNVARHEGAGVGSLILDLDLDDDAVYALEAAQGSQDTGSTWGEALQDARAALDL